MNCRGLTNVGWMAVILRVFSVLPFVVMAFVAIQKLKPSRWLVVNIHKVDWGFTPTGEMQNPKKTLPKALFYALTLVVLGYFFPLLIGTGANPLDRDLWTDGYFSDIAKLIGGVWLRWWIQGASAFSDSFQLLGMTERGMFPKFFSKRTCYGTPLFGILFSASGVILLSWLSFQEIVAAENFLYCFLEVVAIL
ncbi:hypothetical protein NE237_001695 [Protea cynaroides]|uniref:Uncharacterized protein n=1 Tax=Protea cynaroides TaxID=273540 RepID=A0A9Q0QYP7_9MAGN|nr:hypothetical protein NE237_001695 [Protea cynaroides]